MNKTLTFNLNEVKGNMIYTSINGQSYIYLPNEGVDPYELFDKVTSLLRHSTGKALQFMKKNAVGHKWCSSLN